MLTQMAVFPDECCWCGVSVEECETISRVIRSKKSIVTAGQVRKAKIVSALSQVLCCMYLELIREVEEHQMERETGTQFFCFVY